MRIRDITENKGRKEHRPRFVGWPETHTQADQLIRLAKKGFKVENAKAELSETVGFDALLEQIDAYQFQAPETNFADVLVNFLVNLPAKNQAIASMQDAIWADTDLTPMIMPQVQMAEDCTDTVAVVSEALHEDLLTLQKMGVSSPGEKNKKVLMRSFQTNINPDELRVHYLKSFKEKGLLETGKLINATFALANTLKEAKKSGKPSKDELTTMLFTIANNHGVKTDELQEKFKSIYGKKSPIKESMYITENKLTDVVKALHKKFKDLRDAGDTGFSTAFHAIKLAKENDVKPSDLISKYNEIYHGEKINESLVDDIDVAGLAKDIDTTNQPSGAEIKLSDALANKFGKPFAMWYTQLMDYADNGEYPAKVGDNEREVASYLKRNSDRDANFIKLAHDHMDEIHALADSIAKEHSDIVQKELSANKAQGKSGNGSEYKVAEDVVDFPGNPTPTVTKDKPAIVKDFPKNKIKINTDIDKEVDNMAAWAKWKIDHEIESGRITTDNQAVRLHDLLKKEFIDTLGDKVSDPEESVWQSFMIMFDEGIWYYILDKAKLLDSAGLHESLNESKGVLTAHKARNHLTKIINKFVDSSNINLLSSVESFEDKNYFDLAINVYDKNTKKLDIAKNKIIDCMIKNGYVQNQKNPDQFMISDAVLVNTKPIHKTFRTGAYKNREVPTFTIIVTGKKKIIS